MWNRIKDDSDWAPNRGGFYDSLPKRNNIWPCGSWVCSVFWLLVVSTLVAWCPTPYDFPLSIPFPVTLLASCLSAFTSTVIVSSVPWPVILFPSRRDRDHQHGCLRQQRHLRHFTDLQVGLLLFIDHTAQSFFYLISNRCNAWQTPTPTSIFSHPKWQEIFQRRHMTAYFRLSRWYTRTMPAVSLWQTSRLLSSTPFYNAGQSIFRRLTSTCQLIQTKASNWLIFYLIRCRISSTGSTRRGKHTNIWMPLQRVRKHPHVWHHIRIRMILASLYKFELLHVAIPSFLPLRAKLYLGRIDCGKKDREKALRTRKLFSLLSTCIRYGQFFQKCVQYFNVKEFRCAQHLRLQIVLRFFLSLTMETPLNNPLCAAALNSSTSPTPPNCSPTGEDTSSTSYIPQMARRIPTSSTVHTVSFKKVRFPMTQRPDELWIVEQNPDGIETWKPLETFLEELDLTHDPSVIRRSANCLRQQFQVPPRASSDSSSTLHHVLPHPEHSDLHFTGPVSVIPDHTRILQACWGRSANYHSQGPTTSLYWPPWRSTPPASQEAHANLSTLTSSPTTSSPALGFYQQDLRFQDGQLVPFGEMDISDTSV